MKICHGLICGLLALLSGSVGATLGGSSDTVQTDRARLHTNTYSLSSARKGTSTYRTHTMSDANGTLIKEHELPDGTIFAVSWQGAHRPNLQQLLGSHFDALQRVANSSSTRRRLPLSVKSSALVITTGGHTNAYWGVAYLPSRLPTGLTVSDLR